MSAIVMAIMSALAWGISDYGAGVKTRSMSVFAVTGSCLGVGGVGAGVAALLGFEGPLREETVILGASAGLLTVVGLSALYQALGEGRMSVVAPVSSTGVGLPVIVGLLGGDHLAWNQSVGIVLALAGMIAIVGTQAGAGSAARRPVALAGLSAVGLGVFYIIDSAVRHGQQLWFVMVAQLLAGMILGLISLARRDSVPARRDALQLTGIGVVGLAAWLLTTLALTRGPLSLTSTITALYPVVTVVLAIGLGGERLRRVQVAALVAVFAGVAGCQPAKAIHLTRSLS